MRENFILKIKIPSFREIEILLFSIFTESNKKHSKDKRHQQSNSQSAQNLQNSKKGPTREEVFAKIDSVVTNLLAKESTNEAIEQWKDEAIPSKMTQTAVTHLFKIMIEKEPNMRELVLAFISQLTKDEVIDPMHCNEALIKLLQVSSSNNNNDVMAEIASWSVIEGVSNNKDTNKFQFRGKTLNFRRFFLFFLFFTGQ